MQSQIQFLAELAFVDTRLDEYEEAYGDLPEQVKAVDKSFNQQTALVKETEGILNDVKKFAKNSKNTLVELKQKEEKLSKQQFMVRNNKEFDAITKEIEHIRQEYNKITAELRTVSVKEENLNHLLETQKNEAQKIEVELKEKMAELNVINSGQNKEVASIRKVRDKIKSKTDQNLVDEYERVRTFHKDAAVHLRKNSCSGCYSSVPHQKIVLMRNNLDKIFTCENCGRIIYPEDIIVNDSILK